MEYYNLAVEKGRLNHTDSESPEVGNVNDPASMTTKPQE